MMSLTRANLALRGLSPKQRSPHIPLQSSPCFNHVSIIFSPTTKPQLCPCDPPVTQKNRCTPSPIFLLSHLRALEAFSVSGAPTNFLSWLITSFLVPGPHNPPRPRLMSLALLIFLFASYLPPISARSIGHCPSCILWAKLIEGQFTALLNNSQWHFNAPLELVVGQIRQPISISISLFNTVEWSRIYLLPGDAQLRSELEKNNKPVSQ